MSQPTLNEDLNIVANSSLEIELLGEDLNIIQKLDDEPNDVGGLTSAELKETFDKAGNIIKDYLNNQLIPAILADDATEAARAASEAQRKINENDRIKNENARIEAETLRNTAEDLRKSAETDREIAENNRADETAGIVAQSTRQAQIATSAAETAKGYALGQQRMLIDNLYVQAKYEIACDSIYPPTSEPLLVNGRTYRIIVNGTTVDAVCNSETVYGYGIRILKYTDAGFRVINNNSYAVHVSFASLNNGARPYAEKAKASEDAANAAKAEAKSSASEALISEHNAEVWAEGGQLEGHNGEVVLQGMEVGAKGYAQQAQEAKDSAELNARNARVMAEGGKYETKSGEISSFKAVPGAKNYANQAYVFVEGGTFDDNPFDDIPSTIRSDGAKNLADKAKAFAEGGSYKEWEKNGLNYEWKSKTVEKGAKQYAEEAASSADAADDAKKAAESSAAVYDGVVADVNQLKQDMIEQEIDYLQLTIGGIYDLDGTETNRRDRARTTYLSAPFAFIVSPGYKVQLRALYTYSRNGVVFDSYKNYDASQNFFQLDDTNYKYRLSFAKTDGSDFSDDELDSILQNFWTFDKPVVNFVGFGTEGIKAGVTSVGDIYFNTDTKLLRMLYSGNKYTTVPLSKEAVYTCKGSVYLWDGTDMILKNALMNDNPTGGVDITIGGEIKTLTKQSDFSALSEYVVYQSRMRRQESAYSIEFTQGGIASNGSDDNNMASVRVRSNYINGVTIESFTIAQEYLARVCKYNKAGKFLEMGEYGTSFSSIDAENYWVRILVKKADDSTISTSELTDDVIQYGVIKTVKEDLMSRRYYEPRIGSPQLYISDKLDHDVIDDKTSAELYAAYDNLAATYPRFFKRTEDIGVDSYGNTIRSYTLRFYTARLVEGEVSEPNLWDASYDYSTILITSGVHGNEKSASWGLMLAITDILSSKENWAKYIRGNLILKIVPCVNVWGFDNNSRSNYGGVNINRDAYNWETSEGKALKTFFDGNEDAIYYMDVHGTTGNTPYQEISPTSENLKLHARNTVKITASMYDDWLSNFGVAVSAKTVKSTFTGLLISYVEDEKGVPASIVEIPRDDVSGSIVNYLSACKYSKDIVINLLQSLCETVFKF